MKITAIITEQNKIRIDPTIILSSGNKDSYELYFKFLPKKDDTLIYRAVFKLNNNITYSNFLDDNNTVLIPSEVLSSEGVLKIGLIGAILAEDYTVEQYKIDYTGNFYAKEVDYYMATGEELPGENKEKIVYATDIYKLVVEEGVR